MTEQATKYIIMEAAYYDRPQAVSNGNEAFVVTEDPCLATEIFCFAKQHSKYPHCVYWKTNKEWTTHGH